MVFIPFLKEMCPTFYSGGVHVIGPHLTCVGEEILFVRFGGHPLF